jgi:hypothetical protein
MKKILLLLVLLSSGAMAQHKLVLADGDTLDNIYVTEYNKNIVRYVQAAGKKEMEAAKVMEIILPYSTVKYNRGVCCGDGFVIAEDVVQDTKTVANKAEEFSIKKNETAGDYLQSAAKKQLSAIALQIIGGAVGTVLVVTGAIVIGSVVIGSAYVIGMALHISGINDIAKAGLILNMQKK